ncbi:unnamed protein product [Orchesella dallaii]|uniref:Fasciclin-2 n=1 Tax=Orchesella dallaii TaxID=48710 RepID=A0ABP1Q6Z8_9HEXA
MGILRRSVLEAHSGGGRRWRIPPHADYGLVLILSMLFLGVICQQNGEGGGGGGITSTDQNSLQIVPAARNRVYQRALGKSSVFTCSANVEVPDRLTEFKWWWPDGKAIEPTDTRVEIMRDEPQTLTLLFTSIQEQDLGKYRCTALYANSQKLETDFTLRAYVPITFEDAPINQYAVKGQDYKVKCRVQADPEPQVDWKKDHRVLNNSDHFVMDKDGVVIRGVTEADEGVYTCRVRVTSMGTVEERHIQVEVHELPVLTSEPEVLEGVEAESITFSCTASGKPAPEYEWVNHRKQDLRVLERHTVDKYKGTLQIDGIKREDAGVYTCTAKNTAGYVTMKSTLNVITKPVIEEFKNITTQVNGNAILQCRASGDPAPSIRFHKDSNREPFSAQGPQHDSRIVVEQRTQGRETTATIRISDVLRTDDGLYNCIASNQRTKTELLGHITVEYPPTFANTPMKEAWSWNGHPANVTCLAEGIPNATISWFIEGSPERPVDGNMANIKQIGLQSLSSLEVQPIDRSLYGFYKCVATNKLGTAEHRVQLKEAREPGPVLEAILTTKTATTITYKIVGPVNDGGLPVKSFVAQYREDRASWDEHKLKSWPVDQQLFTIENLEPQRTYFVRFAAENEVGLGVWSKERPEITPRRSAPESPTIQNEVNGVAITAYPDKFELIWRVPPDNGEKITAFEISYVPVRNLTVDKGNQAEYQWDPVGPKTVEQKALGEPRHTLRNLAPGTYYRVEIVAENSIGKSAPASIIIKTAAVPGDLGRPMGSAVSSSSSLRSSNFFIQSHLLLSLSSTICSLNLLLPLITTLTLFSSFLTSTTTTSSCTNNSKHIYDSSRSSVVRNTNNSSKSNLIIDASYSNRVISSSSSCSHFPVQNNFDNKNHEGSRVNNVQLVG